MQKPGKGTQKESLKGADLKNFVDLFAALDQRRKMHLLLVLAYAVKGMMQDPKIPVEGAIEMGLWELNEVVARTKEHEKKALRILRGKRRLPGSRGVKAFLG